MRSHRLIGLAGCVLALLAASGCATKDQIDPADVKIVIPPGVAGTIAEYADLVGGDQFLVRGAGVTVGLGRAGDAGVPDQVRKYLSQQMLKHGGVGMYSVTGPITPSRILNDPDTGVVIVEGYVPPAAPVGTRFDVFVQTWPQTQTQWLDGGNLMSSDLRLALSTETDPASDTKTWGVAHGAIFVNPFADRSVPAEAAKLRSGRIPNGGVVAQERPIRLELRRPEYPLANLIMREINRRFGAEGRVAAARSPALIELTLPRAWKKDYLHFLELVMHVGLWGGGDAEEAHARQLAQAVLLPTARYEDISLVWEAMGKPVLPTLRPLYAVENPLAAFAAARAGLRLGDSLAIEPLKKLAFQAACPVQLAAIRELGKAPRDFIQVVPVLRDLLSDANELVRVAAYEALLEHGSAGLIRSIPILDSAEPKHVAFTLDIVPADRDYVIYATISGEPRIVLFGRNLPVKTPVFFCPSDELVTINANPGDRKVSVYRRIPRDGQMSATMRIDPLVENLVAILGNRPARRELPRSFPASAPAATPSSRPAEEPESEWQNLGLTYSQVVSVLYGMCKQGHIPARFVLQRADEMKRIYLSGSTLGRPDMPEDEPKSP